MVRQIRCTIMRGGTSKAVFLKENDLPAQEAQRQAVILSIFGSPDRRQIDGLGGADPLTSKLALIGAARDDEPASAGAHLRYTFGQVEIERANVDWHSLCGNISAAVGAYAIREGFVRAVEPITHVRVYNTNLARMLTIEVPVREGEPQEEGDYAVPGVPGTGARILVDFAATAGGATGRLLPTGNVVDRLDVPGLGAIDASLVDIGNAHVFIRASDVGMRGTESAREIDGDAGLLERLERIRAAGAERIGMVDRAARASEVTPATPILCIVAPPADYRDENSGRDVAASGIDLLSRLQFMQRTHKTYAGTSTVCTGVAARIPGTLVHEVSRPESRDRLVVRIGHPAGVIETETSILSGDSALTVRRATLGRTARRIMEGQVFVPDRICSPPL